VGDLWCRCCCKIFALINHLLLCYLFIFSIMYYFINKLKRERGYLSTNKVGVLDFGSSRNGSSRDIAGLLSVLLVDLLESSSNRSLSSNSLFLGKRVTTNAILAVSSSTVTRRRVTNTNSRGLVLLGSLLGSLLVGGLLGSRLSTLLGRSRLLVGSLLVGGLLVGSLLGGMLLGGVLLGSRLLGNSTRFLDIKVT
jgi:hypothetical protein